MAKNIFNSIAVQAPGRNYFDLSNEFVFSCNMGKLVPVFWDFTVPGDTYHINCESLVRFAPMIAPVYHKFYCSVHYFAVPLRVLWENYPTWTADISTDAPLPVAPYFEIDGDLVNGSAYRLLDYLGIPLAGDIGSNVIKCSAFVTAAYRKIWADYYRAEFFQEDNEVWKLQDGLNAASDLLTLLARCWEHDYFTGALPFAQAGEQVTIPISSIEKDVRVYTNNAGTGPNTWSGSGATTSAPLRPSTNGTIPADQLYANTDGLPIGAGSINDFRTARQLQMWKEKNARAGQRLNEIDFMHFAVKSQDARLQRAEYITGIKSPVIISEVLNTAGGDLPQGNMSGHGVGIVGGRAGSFWSAERCVIMGIMSIMPKTSYQQGVDRRWQYFDPINDQYWPAFANLGEQAILNQEIYAANADPQETFGYIPRYAHMKYMNNRVAGDFRTSLNYWTASRIFDTPPALNATFLQADPTTRIFAVEDPEKDHMYVHHMNRIGARRPMPKYGTPI